MFIRHSGRTRICRAANYRLLFTFVYNIFVFPQTFSICDIIVLNKDRYVKQHQTLPTNQCPITASDIVPYDDRQRNVVDLARLEDRPTPYADAKIEYVSVRTYLSKYRIPV